MNEEVNINALYRVAIYIRLSKEDTDKVVESESITNQRNILLAYLKEKKLALAGEYVDDGVSGTTFDRPAFNRLIEDIEDGKINMVVTKDLSRLGREYIQSGYYVEQYFPMKGVRYVSILDNVDTSRINSSENDIAPFRSILNEMYAKDTSKKIRIVFKQKKEDGQLISTSAPYGYMKDPNDKHHLIIDPETAPIIKRMFQLIIDGYGTKNVADILTDDHIPTPAMKHKYQVDTLSYKYGYWNAGSVRRILRNNVYIGMLEQGKSRTISYKNRKRVRLPKDQWIVLKNMHEPILDEETFYTVQRLLDTSAKKTVKRSYLLTGLLKCAECGGSISIGAIAKNRNFSYTTCNLYAAYTKRHLCTPHTLNYQALELMVVTKVRELCKLCMDNEKLENALREKIENNDYKKDLEKRLNEINDSKEKIQKNLNKLYDDRLNDLITFETYKNVFDKQKSRLDSLNEEVISIEKKLGIYKEEADAIFSFDYKKIINEFLTLKEPTKEIMAKIIDRIEIHQDKQVDIYYRIKAFEELK